MLLLLFTLRRGVCNFSCTQASQSQTGVNKVIVYCQVWVSSRMKKSLITDFFCAELQIV